jgi:hypothetical protein
MHRGYGPFVRARISILMTHRRWNWGRLFNLWVFAAPFATCCV